MKVYPLGYSRQGDLVGQLMQDSKVLLIDIRFLPKTKFRDWSDVELKAKYGKRYRLGLWQGFVPRTAILARRTAFT